MSKSENYDLRKFRKLRNFIITGFFITYVWAIVVILILSMILFIHKQQPSDTPNPPVSIPAADIDVVEFEQLSTNPDTAYELYQIRIPEINNCFLVVVDDANKRAGLAAIDCPEETP